MQNSAPVTFEPIHRQWYTNQAFFTHFMPKTDVRTQKDLALAILHAYSKISSIDPAQCARLGIQTTPLFGETCSYHRSTPNELLEMVQEAYASDMGVKAHEVELVHSPHLKEVMAREATFLEVESLEAFASIIDLLLLGRKFDRRIIIDFSKYLEKYPTEPKLLRDRFVLPFEELLVQKLNNHPDIAVQLASKLHVVAFGTYKRQHLIFVPEFGMANRHGSFMALLSNMMCRTGFRLDPTQAKLALLDVLSLDEILQKLGIQKMALWGGPEPKFPQVCCSLEAFLDHPAMVRFKKLSAEKLPYLQVLPALTYCLLEGLKSCQIEESFKRKGLQELLQLSYYRMIEACKEASFRKNNQIAFCNQIEIIHQELMMILAIAKPHNDGMLADSIVKRLTLEKDPLLPPDLGITPLVHLKPSGMHLFASCLASCERLKGSKRLNVMVLKDSYYNEADESLKRAKDYSVYVYDSDRNSYDRPLAKELHFDLIVTEFHHNIVDSRKVYRPEDVVGQIERLIDKGLISDRCTLFLDTTIDLEHSPDIHALFLSTKICDCIKRGKLSLVMGCSAQKFLMFGLDNYYGGIAVTINNEKEFTRFNERMNEGFDQLFGLSYQGLAHIQKYASRHFDPYRQVIMANTERLYAQVPKAALFYPGSKNPMQISRLEDPRLFFIDIKFPGLPETQNAFRKRLVRYVEEEGLPLTFRASFGFHNDNLTTIGGKKLRLSPGLEHPDALTRYGTFLSAVQQALTNTPREADIDASLAKSLSKLEL